MKFKKLIEDSAERKNSNIILALDLPFHEPAKRQELMAQASRIVDKVGKHVCAVKINHHLTLPLGVFDGVQELIRCVHEEELPVIMDCKVNDVGATNRVIAQYYYSAGFDALIANPFVGWDEGLQPVFELASALGKGVILLVFMSHKGAHEGYGQTVYDAETGEKTVQYKVFAKKALEWKADGAVVGAKWLDKIQETRCILKENVPIYSPGIGAQGGNAADAVKAGAHYLIVGREIIQSTDPSITAKKLSAISRAPHKKQEK